MKQRTSGMFAGTMVVKLNSWHGRLYQYWRRDARFKNTDTYRENLCHYSRVVLIWAPLTLVRNVSWTIRDFCEPGTDIFWNIVDSIGGFIGGHGGSKLGNFIDKFIARCCQFVSPPKLGKKITLSWASRLYHVVILGVMVSGIIGGIMWAILYPFQFLILLLVSAVMLIFFALICVGIVRWIDSQKEEHKAAPSTPIRDTLQLVGHMAMAKKRGVCPYIVFAEDTKELAAEPVTSPETIPQLQPLIVLETVSEEQEERVLEPA